MYSVSFRLYYKTLFGEDLFVVGNIPELSGSNEEKHPLMWTEGHIWVSKVPLVTSTPRFTYGYIMKD